MAGSLVIIPTYNEAENIEKLVRNIFAQQRAFEVLWLMTIHQTAPPSL